jgi:hypothetical protein
MKKTLRHSANAIALCFMLSAGQAQEHGQGHEYAEHESFTPHHTLGLVIGHAQVFKGRDAAGNRKLLSLPSWGIDYTWMFKPKWGIGLHTDIIVETFEVEKHLESGGYDEVVERSRPLAPAIVGIYKPNRHWGFLFGTGLEYAKEATFFLTRAGAEYSAELPRGWEVFGSLNYDFKWNAYDTWTLGLGISKVLGRKHSRE